MVADLLSPVLLVLVTLVLGPYLLQVVDGAIGAAVAGRRPGRLWLEPLQRGAWLWLQPANHTERPDNLNCSSPPRPTWRWRRPAWRSCPGRRR
jgi:NADH-quinone oxidoreductase subunit H